MRLTNNSACSEDASSFKDFFDLPTPSNEPPPPVRRGPARKKKAAREALSSKLNDPPCPSCVIAASKTSEEVVCRGPAPCEKCRKAKKTKEQCLAAAVPGHLSIDDDEEKMKARGGDGKEDTKIGDGEEDKEIVDGDEEEDTEIEDGKKNEDDDEYEGGDEDEDEDEEESGTEEAKGKKLVDVKAKAKKLMDVKPAKNPYTSSSENDLADEAENEREVGLGGKRVYDKERDGRRTNKNGGLDGGFFGDYGIRYD
ncbi:uncharacterized protein L3040_005405 [Drepanopeziza brunnea f. sp. 'multigermtubi']|uniref:Uncharacterized protein n=1 Tax=Marssonina brunnea f. sp. multigermtubi (strain MB_m1) TaxID=1072389 RepID=K1WXE4_MARBU|nr:uncharacterized protein MBM_04764 [Drepanopeziza brunnea f. sp. 'multigermtubi' MB_m1]EKD17187.1 hypothetical protein MBM_04764 [Drepanopeziza brunnea f. sp. 'multigermtubi' MB_m1]KAJ5041839.1 hypothetical protein L3040_005405 [Drepanopeziza brunnea f. sp. 'multigermtubi']